MPFRLHPAVEGWEPCLATDDTGKVVPSSGGGKSVTQYAAHRATHILFVAADLVLCRFMGAPDGFLMPDFRLSLHVKLLELVQARLFQGNGLLTSRLFRPNGKFLSLPHHPGQDFGGFRRSA